MEETAIQLFVAALQTALLLTLPMVGAVAVVGIIVGVAQTVVQVQDQNVSFLPKLAAIAALVTLAGFAGFGLLIRLMGEAIAALPRMSGH
jgi:flagellar biosynthetic protein FliQ